MSLNIRCTQIPLTQNYKTHKNATNFKIVYTKVNNKMCPRWTKVTMFRLKALKEVTNMAGILIH